VRRGDPMPHIRAAGKTLPADGGVATLFSPPQAPPTPDELKSFRKSGVSVIGKGTSHYAKPGGAVKQLPDYATFGKPNRSTDTTAQLFAAMKVPNFAPGHRPYKSELAEPLGKSAKSYVILPEHMKETTAFGKKSTTSESLKGLMYPTENPTAGLGSPSKEPGFQPSRVYGGTYDPERRFGKPNAMEPALSLSPTKVVHLQDTLKRGIAQPQIGSPRSTGCAPLLPQGHVFGKPLPHRDITMRETLMHGSDGADDFLGQPYYTSPRLREQKRQHMLSASVESRAFGVPSVRSDLPSPKFAKITGCVNYGDERGASECLFPSASIATQSHDRPLPDLTAAQELSDRCFGASDKEVAAAFKMASAAGPVTAVSFKRALDALDQ